jgi:large subunit ribosomal protein L18
MERLKKKKLRHSRIKQGIRKKIGGTAERPRLTIYRSNTDIYAQIINDDLGVTIASISSKQAGVTSGTPVEKAKAVGIAIAEKALATNIEKVVFDRNGYLYHGRVKALADGAREKGLNF